MTANSPSGQQRRERFRARLWRRRPRAETSLLLLAFITTVAAKLLAVREYHPGTLWSSWLRAVVGDIGFFAAMFAIVGLVYAARPIRCIAGCAVVLALPILGWSVANAAWLSVTGVQLQLGVILVVLRHPAEFWPTVQPYVTRLPVAVCALAVLATVALVGWAGWRVLRPAHPQRQRKQHAWRAAGFAVVLLVASVVQLAHLPRGDVSSMGQVLNYSSHAHALLSMIPGLAGPGEPTQEARLIPRAGQRTVSLPPVETAERPNVLVVMLESVSYAASGLGDNDRCPMPTLARMAAEGAEFVDTHVPVSQTGKAFWATLSGTTPDVCSDFVEAVVVDRPYEGLPALLRRAGYRSAFFQMAKGSFECAPGTFANFAFDWAWFRENLADPSANLGYLAGDDFRMLDPAFEWALQSQRPFLLMMITSAAHDPYEVPNWFGVPRTSDQERYLQTLEYTDAFLAELCRRLEQHGLANNTLICVLGDHGDCFRPEAQRMRWVPYEEVLRVPWVIRWPGHVPAGRRCEWPCSQMDVTPTILSVLGYDISAAGFEGLDALEPIDPNRRLYFSAWFAGSPLGYIQGGRKWLYWPRTGELFMYDLRADPDERLPTPARGPDQRTIVAELHRWQQDARLSFDAKRFRERFLFEHWWAFSSGRYARAYYVP